MVKLIIILAIAYIVIFHASPTLIVIAAVLGIAFMLWNSGGGGGSSGGYRKRNYRNRKRYYGRRRRW